ncbi:hypothetical protein Pint_06831 [Pistacia integerrima]|uniref:Uncharacterized protein n=1 Tax=Pistacia integerrima TaxID=434235 RepID=A0ACC0Y0M9_9ROSI|nr:hypothetical protein Pint_06831 [Pistacia integerrima]
MPPFKAFIAVDTTFQSGRCRRRRGKETKKSGVGNWDFWGTARFGVQLGAKGEVQVCTLALKWNLSAEVDLRGLC